MHAGLKTANKSLLWQYKEERALLTYLLCQGDFNWKLHYSRDYKGRMDRTKAEPGNGGNIFPLLFSNILEVGLPLM